MLILPLRVAVTHSATARLLYFVGTNRLEPLAIERAVELRRSDATLQPIAAALNSEGLPTKHGAVWRAGTVQAVLMRAG
jgi:hypothetical protein